MTLTVFDDVDQGSSEWFEQRRGIVTASVMKDLITPAKVEPANNETQRNLIRKLAAERITGYVEETFLSRDMERGIEEEPYARTAYAESYGVRVDETGLMVRDFGDYKIGYSPDGLVNDDGGIEIKSRKPHIHVRHVLSGAVPPENRAQLQVALLVTEREWIDYVSFSGGMALWTKRVYADEKWQETIHTVTLEVEKQVTEMIAAYEAATAGLPMTQRVELLQDMEIKI